MHYLHFISNVNPLLYLNIVTTISRLQITKRIRISKALLQFELLITSVCMIGAFNKWHFCLLNIGRSLIAGIASKNHLAIQLIADGRFFMMGFKGSAG